MSSPDNSDDELQRAIALSLEDPTPSTPAKQNSQTSSPDRDFERAMALPLESFDASTVAERSREASNIIVISDSEDDANLGKSATRKPRAQYVESMENKLRGRDHRDTDLRTESSHGDGLQRIHTQRIRADAESIGNAGSSFRTMSQDEPSKMFIPQPTVPIVQSPTGLNRISKNGVLDRKKMEEERLARARKRKALSISPPPLNRKITSLDQMKQTYYSVTSRPGKRLAMQVGSPKSDGGFPFFIPEQVMDSRPLNLAECIPAHEALLVSSKTPEASRMSFQAVISCKQQMDLMKPGVHFPDGVVRKTWAQGYPRDNDIKIEEVLQKNDLEFAVLSAFQWDTEWVISKLDMVRTKLMCVVQATNEEEKSRMRDNAPPSIRFCFPSMAGNISCMHSKLQLLAHPTHLRVVVPSANLVPYDWGEEGGVIENIIFIIDLPRLENGQKANVNSSTAFHRELTYFLKAMEMDQRVLDSLVRFDFSRTAHLAFVHSIGGSHSGSDWKRTGYSGLGSAIQELGLARKEQLDIDFVSASIGSLTYDFIKSIYLAAQGDDGTAELNWRSSRPSKSKTQSGQKGQTDAEERISKEVEEHFRIYFPSRDTVANCKGGIGAGGTICFQSRWYDGDKFPRSLMRDCKSQRSGLLMHNKMIFARPQKPLLGRNNELYAAWAYVGSANLSEAAWGRLSKDKSTKSPKMNCRNWECGVVIPVPVGRQKPTEHSEISSKEEGKGKRKGKGKDTASPPPTFRLFEGVVPVPMGVPGEVYGDKRPWFYDPRG